MTARSITFVPVGGLGNRMKAISAAVTLAHETETHLHIIWFKDCGMGCPFYELFQPFDLPNVQLSEARWADKILYDRPRRKNLYIPYLFEKVAFDMCLYENETSDLYGKEKDFLQLFHGLDQGAKVFMASYQYFLSKRMPQDCFNLFHPTVAMSKRIEERKTLLPPKTFGVHIRRTDNIHSIQESPLESFIQKMDALPQDISFYLATDSEEVKRSMKARYGGRIVTSPHTAQRGNPEGIKEALVELYTLASTQEILGSHASTFSEAAAYIGHSRLEILKRNKE